MIQVTKKFVELENSIKNRKKPVIKNSFQLLLDENKKLKYEKRKLIIINTKINYLISVLPIKVKNQETINFAIRGIKNFVKNHKIESF